MFNRLFLEVIAKAEIAQHLKESMMSGGVANIIEIVVLTAGPDTFLRTGRSGRWRRFQPCEHILERDHPCIDEHQCRIVVRNERSAGYLTMAGIDEIIEEAAADIICRLHGSSELGVGDARDKQGVHYCKCW